MSGDGAGLLLDWACQRTCACERWGRETPQRTAPGEALVSRQWTRVRFPPPPPRPPHVSPARSRSRGAGPPCVLDAVLEFRMRSTAPNPSDDGLPGGWDPRDQPVDARDPVSDEERIGDRDLAERRTRTGRLLVDALARLVAALGRVWRWSLANLALVITVLVGGPRGHGGHAGHRRDARRPPQVVAPGRAHGDRDGGLGAHHGARQGPRRAGATAAQPRGPAPGDLPVLPLGARTERDGRPGAGGIPRHARAPSPAQQGPRCLGGGRLRHRPGAVARVARPPLAHDVMAGWLVGLAWLAAVVTGHRVKATLDRRQRSSDDPWPQRSRRRTARPASSRATGTRNGEQET